MVIFGTSFFYVVSLLILFFSSVLQCYVRSKLFLVISYVGVITIIFVSGLRISGGTDLDAYLNLWNQLVPFSKETYNGNYSYFEPGIRYFLSFLKGVYNHFSLYLIAISAVIHFLLMISVVRLNGNTLIALVVFFLNFFVSYSLNASAQAITMVVLIFLLPILYQKRFLMYSTIVTIMAFFHKSILLALPIYMISKVVRSVWLYMFVLVISVLLYYFSILENLSTFIGFDIKILQAVYGASTVGVLDFSQRLVLLLFCYFSVSRVLRSDFDWFVLKLYALSLPLYIVLLELPVFATRVHFFFRILEVVIVSRTFESISKSNIKLLYVFLVFVLYIPGFYIQITHPDSILRF